MLIFLENIAFPKGNAVFLGEYSISYRSLYFSKRKHELKGIEVPLILQPISERPNIKYMGYIDLVIYDKRNGEYTIFDIKTSSLFPIFLNYPIITIHSNKRFSITRN